MKLAALILTASVSTSSITSSSTDLYRDLVNAAELAQHLDADLDACMVELAAAELAAVEAPEPPAAELPQWVWPAAAAALLGSFSLGFVLRGE